MTDGFSLSPVLICRFLLNLRQEGPCLRATGAYNTSTGIGSFAGVQSTIIGNIGQPLTYDFNDDLEGYSPQSEMTCSRGSQF